MIHAYRPEPLTIVIVAVESIDAFEALATSLIEGGPKGGTAHRPDFTERMLEEHLERFDPEILPIIVEFEQPSDVLSYIEHEGLELVSTNKAFDLYRAMIAPVIQERRSKDARDDRTIGEITGYDKNDPYDRRTDEEKARHAERQEKAKQAYDKAAAAGQLSSESFSPASGDKLHISDVNLRKDASGKTIASIDALGTKGLHTRTADQERLHRLEEAERDATAHTDYHEPADGSERQSKRASDYLFAFIDTQRVGAQVFVLVVPRVQWLRDQKLDDRHLAEALTGVIPDGFEEGDPGEFSSDMAPEDMIEAMQTAGFHPDLGLREWYGKIYSAGGGLLDLMAPAPAPDPAAPGKAPIKRQRSGSFSGETPEGNEDAKLTEYLDEHGNDTLITPNKLSSRYYRVTVIGPKLDDLDQTLRDAFGFRFQKRVFVKRDATYGCWYACVAEGNAKDICNVLVTKGYDASVEEVDHRGVLRDKVQTMAAAAPAAPLPPRPWDADTTAWDALTEEERAENRKLWKGEEFILAEEETRKGIVIHVCPKAWFERENSFFEGDHDISHLLPDTMERVETWSYHDTSRQDWNHLSAELEIRRKFKSNLFLAVVFNNRDA